MGYIGSTSVVPSSCLPSLYRQPGTFDRNLKAPLSNILLFVLPGEVLGVQVPSSCLPSPDRQLGFLLLLGFICDRLLFVLPGQVFEVQVASPPPVCPPLIDNLDFFTS